MIAALAPVCQAQAKADTPFRLLKVRGLSDSTGAKLMLINAVDPNRKDPPEVRAAGAPPPVCTGSRIVPASAWRDVTPPDAFRSKLNLKTYEIDLAANVDKGCWCEDRKAGVAVLAPGRAVAYRGATVQYGKLEAEFINRLCPNPLDRGEKDPEPEMLIEMRPKREVDVMVWAPEDGDMLSMSRDDIANADWIYHKELAGITLHPVFQKIKRDLMPKCSKDMEEEACCLGAAKSSFFQPGVINIFYGNGTQKFSCGSLSAIFINDSPILGDAAHEIAHQLGLNQTDHSPGQNAPNAPKALYSQGHTTRVPDRFGCDNVMWEGTHFFKDTLSPAQAFWMSQNSNSFLNLNGLNNGCTIGTTAPPGTVITSHCPFLSEGQEVKKPNRCEELAVTTSQVFIPKFLGEKEKHPKSCPQPGTTYRNGLAIETALMERYKQLSMHVKGRPDLRLGAVGKGEFKAHWEPYVAVNLAHPRPSSPEEEKKVRRGLVPGYIGIKRDLRNTIQNLVSAIWAGEGTKISGCVIQPSPEPKPTN